jgi:hypothetical protein
MSDLLLQEITEGQGMKLAQAAKLFPPYRLGRPVTISCLIRWICDGIRTPGGGRVKLEAARLGKRYLTTKPAVKRFLAAQAAEAAPAAGPAPRPPAGRKRASDHAADELTKLGI